MKKLASAFLVALLVFAGCTTTGTPQPGTPSTIDCVKGVASDAIADAQQKAITVISTGVTRGFSEDVIVRNLESLAMNMVPGAIECGLQYLVSKLSYDAEHAAGNDQGRQKKAEAAVARAYFRSHPVQFASPTP